MNLSLICLAIAAVIAFLIWINAVHRLINFGGVAFFYLLALILGGTAVLK